MDNDPKRLILQTGQELLKTGLVARTWGNVSCRSDDGFFITPSGLSYLSMHENDIVLLDPSGDVLSGRRRPSSEKAVHASAYKAVHDAGFIIHTHQSAASAIGLAGFDTLEMCISERERLGGIALAKYALPGTAELASNVSLAMRFGAHTVLMAHHGALVCGADRGEAMARALLLEEICTRNIAFCSTDAAAQYTPSALAVPMLEALRKAFAFVRHTDSAAVLAFAQKAIPLYAQLDDMAQMTGFMIPSALPSVSAIREALCSFNAVFVPGVGAFICACDADDADALVLLVEKAALCAMHTAALGAEARLDEADCATMRNNYLTSYSKQKNDC